MNSDLDASALHSTCRGRAEVNCAVTEQIRLWLAFSCDTDVTSQPVASIFMERQGHSPAGRWQMAPQERHLAQRSDKLSFTAHEMIWLRHRESECCMEVWRYGGMEVWRYLSATIVI